MRELDLTANIIETMTSPHLTEEKPCPVLPPPIGLGRLAFDTLPPSPPQQAFRNGSTCLPCKSCFEMACEIKDDPT